jgi:5,10-methylenetetrahydromethanopterin reductase
MTLGVTPEDIELRWVPPDLPPVPVDVFAAGPRAIAAGARHADRITIAVGAQPERVAWALDVARSASHDRQPALGAYVNVFSHPDLEVARSLALPSTASMARFSSMLRTPSGPLTPEDRAVYEAIRAGYDMTQHASGGSVGGQLLPDNFVDRFAIVGSPEICVERLRVLVDLGIERFVIMGPQLGDPEHLRTATELFVREVMPAVKG